jgi:hypothetical protein
VPPPWVEMAVMVVMVMVVAVVGLGVQVAVELVKMLRCPRSVALSQQLLATEQASPTCKLRSMRCTGYPSQDMQ